MVAVMVGILLDLWKHFIKLVFLSGVLVGGAYAGSYEDYFNAISKDRVDVVRILTERGIDPNSQNEDGQPALHFAIVNHSHKVFSFLLEQTGLDLEQLNPNRESAVMLAAYTGQLELVKTLVEREAEINSPGWTTLHYAATQGHLDVVGYLLENDAYIDAQAPNGTTPLMMAAYYSSASMVKLLLEKGADPSIRNELGKDALDYAKMGVDRGTVKLLEQANHPDYILK